MNHNLSRMFNQSFVIHLTPFTLLILAAAYFVECSLFPQGKSQSHSQDTDTHEDNLFADT